jgi:antitoxin VapB
MALNIKNPDVERLAEDVARLTGTSKTEAIRQALLERRDRVAALASSGSSEERLRQFLELRVWPSIPRKARRRWTKDEEDTALGYGESGEPV